jgi:hypothetical protein
MLVLFPFLAGVVLPAAAATDARMSESYGKLPLHFEANRGQTDKDVRFLSRGAGYSLYLTGSEAVLVLAKPNPDVKGDVRPTHKGRGTPTQAQSVALRMAIVGANSKSVVSGLDELPGKANYFIGRDPAKWRTNVPTYAKVHYREVYPGIDLVYYGNQRQLEYDFVVAPGANPKKIVLDFKGADKLQIDARGDLVLRAAGGDIRQHKPIVYQEIDGIRQEIAGGYVRKGANRVGFQLATYDTTRPLIIDPVVLAYSTYLGGSGIDWSGSISVDAEGNAYLTGTTNWTDFPTTPAAFQPVYPGFVKVFVTKLNPDGSALVYSTYLGGDNSDDSGWAIAVDAEGNAYVTGYTTSNNFPTTAGVFQPASAGYYDAFVAKLNPTGSALVYSTYLGGSPHPSATSAGSGTDIGFGIAVDGTGNAYVTGYTTSDNFPTTPGAFQPVSSAPTNAFDSDAFVTKLNPTGSALVYSTYLGGSGASINEGHGIAVDADGNAYVTGGTHSPDFPTTAGAFQTTGSGGAFVTKFDPTGSALVYSTYLGSASAYAIAIDGDRNAYVTGVTNSVNFPTTPGAFQSISGGGNDVFVTKLDPAGSALVYSTYLGGSGFEWGLGVAVDAAGNAHVTGYTSSINFPTTPGAFQPIPADPIGSQFANHTDAFVTKLNPAGSSLVYSTYLGGSGGDTGAGITVDARGNAYVSGQTTSFDFPTTLGAFQRQRGGGPAFNSDAFVAKIIEAVVPPPLPAP